jgi:tetratricopeptide (TPR) repeat protein
MKRIFIIFPVLSLIVQFAFAQPTKAEIDKMMKQSQELMKKYSNDTSVNKMMKNLQDQQKQITDAMKNRHAGNNGATNMSFYDDPGAYSNVDNWKFPAKNTALLSSLPKKIFTKAELVSFLNDTYIQLAKKLPPGISSSVQSIAAKYNNDGNKMGDAAVTGWYTNYREESFLLIIKAAANNPDDGLLLNNCAAILNMSGIEQKAIPILKYLLQFNTGSGMVLNNLGQAYAGLGETDTAMVYLGRCIKVEPENPEANNTAGQIEAAKGNTEKGVSYLEQSIKGAYNKPAELKLRKIKKGSNIVPLVRPRIKLPDYFNMFKYKLPAQCTSTNNAAVADAEYKAFQKNIGNQLKDYGNRFNQLQNKLYQNPLPAKIFKKDDFVAQPFHEFCGIMARDVMKDFNEKPGEYDNNFYADYAALENEYKGKLKIINEEFNKKADQCCGEGKTTSCCPTTEEKCKAYNDLANQYLPKFAYITGEWQKKEQLYFQRLFDEQMYWSYLSFHPSGDDYFRVQCFYPIITQYLTMLAVVGTTKIIEPCHFEPTTATADSNAIKDYDCPIDIELGFGPGKIQLNCEKFTFNAGEGIIFGFEKNFKTKQSTVSIGIGAKVDLGAKAGPLEAGVGASATESVFITFDGNNGIADAGLKNEAGLSAGATGIVKDEANVGSTLGINSGWNFNEGPFKGMIGPAPVVQQNKNVNTYKPNN